MGVFLLVMLILVNVVIGGVLLFFIQNIHIPKIDVTLNLSQITTDELNFSVRISMDNDNHFDLIAKNLNIIGKTPDGNTIMDLRIPGGTVPAMRQRIFTANTTVSFNGKLSSRIYSSVQGIFGVNLAGIVEKTIPFQINLTASFQELFNDISVPSVSLFAEVNEITEAGVLFHATVNVQNPNLFEMSLDNVTAQVETENGAVVGGLSHISGNITPNGTSQFQFNGTFLYDALNAKTLTLRIAGNAGVHLMGIYKSIALSAAAYLIVPEIRQLLFHNESLDIILSIDAKLRLRGFLTTIGLRLSNPSKIPLQANDLLCSIYGITGESKKIIAQKNMVPATLEPTIQNYLETQLLVSYVKLFTSGIKKIFPDWFVIQIEGSLSIVGVNQSIPVSINATINPHLLRP